MVGSTICGSVVASAVERLGQQPGGGGLARPPRAGEQVGVADPTLPDGVAQRRADGLLADELAEGLRAVLAVQRLEGHGPPTLSAACDKGTGGSMDRAPAVDPAVSDTSTVAGSGQATLRHTGWSAESCFLPDL